MWLYETLKEEYGLKKILFEPLSEKGVQYLIQVLRRGGGCKSAIPNTRGLC